jgi:vancomycin resistance protein YoaR
MIRTFGLVTAAMCTVTAAAYAFAPTCLGRPVADEAEARSVALREAEKLVAREVTVTTAQGGGADVRKFKLSELGVRVDVDATVERLRRSATRQTVLGLYSLNKQIDDLPMATSIDEAKGVEILLRLKEEIDTPAMSARLDLENHQVIPETPGASLDVSASLEEVLRTAQNSLPQVSLKVVAFAPLVSSEFIRTLDISTVLASYETSFSRGGEQVRRGQNIDVAATKLDGIVISAGETISFNAVVGDRSEANGFKKAWEIFKGEMVEGVGGGTCQVASTFHAASFFGGLDVIERLPHSRPSAYIPMGLDSTVVYPAVDLKLRNPHPFPVVVHAKTQGNKLKVEILGREKPAEVRFSRDVVAEIPFTRKLVEESFLSGKKVIHKQHGIRGFRIRRVRELRYRDGTSKVETTTDQYPPTADIYQVPAGFDESLLPALPSADPSEQAAPVVAAAALPALAPALASQGPAAECTDCLQVVEGKGAHAPNAFQSAPSKSMRVAQ